MPWQFFAFMVEGLKTNQQSFLICLLECDWKINISTIKKSEFTVLGGLLGGAL
jgi:hypothetical protein